MPRRSPLVIGHRGAPGHRPEHTRSSYLLALAQGVDAVEPDVVFTSDGVAVVRHENEIGGTTDVAEHPAFAARRTTRTVDGEALTGWFTEDFTWDELATLRCRERIPHVRAASARFDGEEPPLRLADLLRLVAEASPAPGGTPVGVVLEIKHATYFGARGIDVAGAIAGELRRAGWADGGRPLYVEWFEQVVRPELRALGGVASSVYLLAPVGAPADLVAADGDAAETYREQRSAAGLDRLAGEVEGISLDKAIVLGEPGIVAAAHARGLCVFTWTARPENAFLAPEHRGPGDDAEFGDYAAEWQALVDAGVDGVFVDHPDLGAATFRRPRPAGDAATTPLG